MKGSIRLPSGLQDVTNGLAERKERICRYVGKYLYQRGYRKVTTPMLEYKEVFTPFNLSSHQRFYECHGRDQRTLVLRSDMTIPIARAIGTNAWEGPQRLYYVGDVLINEEEHQGKVNQITQAGIELIGYSSLKAELECMSIIANWSERLLPTPICIELGHAKVGDAILEALHLDKEDEAVLLGALYSKKISDYMNCIQQYQSSALYPLLAKWPRLFGTVQEIQEELSTIILPVKAQRLLDELYDFAQLIQPMFTELIRIDMSTKAPQTYYTGLTCKGYVEGMASYLVSGGRYDQLLGYFQEESMPAMGIAFDIDCLSQLVKDEVVKPSITYVYAEPKQLEEAYELIRNNEGYSLSLGDTLEEAKAQANREKAELIIVATDRERRLTGVDSEVIE